MGLAKKIIKILKNLNLDWIGFCTVKQQKIHLMKRNRNPKSHGKFKKKT